MAISPTQAIEALWATHGEFVTLFPGGLWTGEAPDTVDQVPYAVLMEIGSAVEDYTTSASMIRSEYQLSCMASDLADAESLAKTVRDAFHKATPSIADATVMHCLCGEPRWTTAKGLGVGGLDCWICYVEIEIYWSR